MFARDARRPSFSPSPAGRIQRAAKSGAASPVAVPRSVHETLAEPGRPLDAGARRAMETSFGHDFSKVRVHDGPRAAESARSVNALAYTVGRDVVFGERQYRPGDREGRELLAHELAHVVQQQRGGGTTAAATPQTFAPGGADDALEREADRAAASAAAGERVEPVAASGPRLSRATDEKKTAAPAAKKPPAHVAHDYQGQNGIGRFHADLDTESGTLDVTLRLKFNVTDPQNWKDGELDRWKRAFITQSQQDWSRRYNLVPDGDCADWKMPPVKVDLHVKEVASDWHYQVFVASESAAKPGVLRGKDVAHNFSQSDVKETFLPESKTHAIPATHEVGHMLGLEHIGIHNPACTNGGEGKACYGTTDEQMNDIMGKGRFVSARDYQSFVEVMDAITGCKWKAASPASSSNLDWLWYTLGALALGGLVLGGLALGGVFKRTPPVAAQ